MDPDPFSLLLGCPHIIVAILSYLDLCDVFVLSSASQVIRDFLASDDCLWQPQIKVQLLRRALSNGAQPMSTTESIAMLTSKKRKLERTISLIRSQPRDPWFYQPLEVAVIWARDQSEAKTTYSSLRQLGLNVQLLHGPLSKSAQVLLASNDGLLVLVAYKLVGWFHFSYLRTLVMLNPPKTYREFDRLHQWGALTNICLVDDLPNNMRHGFLLAKFLKKNHFDCNASAIRHISRQGGSYSL